MSKETEDNQPHVWAHRDTHYIKPVALWLEPCEGDEFLGLIIGHGRDIPDAIKDAREALQRIEAQLAAMEKREGGGV